MSRVDGIVGRVLGGIVDRLARVGIPSAPWRTAAERDAAPEPPEDAVDAEERGDVVDDVWLEAERFAGKLLDGIIGPLDTIAHLGDRVVARALVEIGRGALSVEHGYAWAVASEGPPRRAFSRPPNALFAPGMSRSWQFQQAYGGLVKHRELLSVAVPRELAHASLRQGLFRDAVEPLLDVSFRRVGRDCPDDAAAVVARAHAEEILPSVPSTRLTPEVLRGPWLVQQLLNGMAPARLRRAGEGRHEVHYLATDLPFGDELGRGDRTYELPDVVVGFVTEDDVVHADEIRVRYRKAGPRYTTGGEAAYGRWHRVALRDPTVPAWRKDRARRVAASASVLHGQIDDHIAVGHLVPEMFAVAMWRHLAGLDAERRHHPVFRILAPRLSEVDLVNRSADGVIWGPLGLIPTTSALTSSAMQTRFLHRVAALDWKGFRPRAATIGRPHYHPTIATAYWDEVVLPYVRDALGEDGGVASWWGGPWGDQVRAMFRELHEVSPAWRPWDGDAGIDWLDPSEFAKGKREGDRALSLGHTIDDLVQLVAFAIFTTTLGHGWPNVRQVEAGGDIGHASFGLRRRLDDPAPSGNDDGDWHRAAAPLPSDQAYQLAVADVLTNMDVDTFQKELDDTTSDVPQDPMRGERSLAGRYRALAPRLSELVAAAEPAFAEVNVPSLSKQLSRSNR